MTSSVSVLTLLAPDFEEIEVVVPVDLMRRAGIQVTLASLDASLDVKGRSAITLKADTTLDLVLNEPFTCLFIPGGPGVKKLRADPRITYLVEQYFKSNRLISAICAAPVILKDVGVLKNKRFTAHHSVAYEFDSPLCKDPVVVDTNLITSRGAGTAHPFGLTLIKHLISEEKAKEVAQSISYD
jgi:protein deglycase